MFVLYHSFWDVFRNNAIVNNISWNLFRKVSLILLVMIRGDDIPLAGPPAIGLSGIQYYNNNNNIYIIINK